MQLVGPVAQADTVDIDNRAWNRSTETIQSDC